jgi:hypothetical protein
LADGFDGASAARLTISSFRMVASGLFGTSLVSILTSPLTA